MTPSWQSSSIHPPLPAISHGLVWHGMVQYGMVWRGIVWYGLLSVMAIRKEKHGHIGRLRLYNACIYFYINNLGGTPGLNF